MTLKPKRHFTIQNSSYSVLLLILLLCSTPLHAQIDTVHHPFFPIVIADAKDFFSDAGTFLSRPAHFSQTDWLITGAIIGGTVAFTTVDEDGRKLAARNTTPFLEHLADISRIYGEDYFGVGLSAGIYGTGLFAKNEEIRSTGVVVFEAIAFSAAVTQSLKFLIGRSRPYTNDGNGTFTPLTLKKEHLSFPSGHSTSAFALSSALASRVKNPYVSAGLYSLATLTALSRVYSDDHWVSDIVLGSVIGYLSGTAVARLHETDASSSSIELRPTGNGLCIEWKF